MSFQLPGAGAPVHMPCQYGASRLVYRGPERAFDRPYVACLGGTETFGRFVETPFVERLERRLGVTCVNLGSVNAGLDALIADPELTGLAQGARLTVLQVLGAQNISNRFYRVHPRRNDRFLEADEVLKQMYPEVDFTEFNFNRHLLTRLHDIDNRRFEPIAQELRRIWQARMRLFLDRIGPDVVLLWLYADEPTPPLGPEPGLIDAATLDPLRPLVREVIEIGLQPAHRVDELRNMQFGPLDEPAASHAIGPSEHDRIANTLDRWVAPFL